VAVDVNLSAGSWGGQRQRQRQADHLGASFLRVVSLIVREARSHRVAYHSCRVLRQFATRLEGDSVCQIRTDAETAGQYK
jgi:hypothetical protein